MADESSEGKKAELLSRIDQLRGLVLDDAPEGSLRTAMAEVGRSLDGLTRPGRAQGDPPTVAADGESPPSL